MPEMPDVLGPQGWIDITYLSPNGDFRLSRGNKGTLFILSRDMPAKQRLITAVQRGVNDAEVSIDDGLLDTATRSMGSRQSSKTLCFQPKRR